MLIDCAPTGNDDDAAENMVDISDGGLLASDLGMNLLTKNENLKLTFEKIILRAHLKFIGNIYT